MHIRNRVVGTAIGILTLASAAGSATAADWQALRGVAVTPMSPAQMEAAQGKSTFEDKLKFVSGDTGFTPISFTVAGGTGSLIANRTVSLFLSVNGSNFSVIYTAPTP